jgi:hypothetical protein
MYDSMIQSYDSMIQSMIQCCYYLLSQVYIALITHRSKRFTFISLEIYNKI